MDKICQICGKQFTTSKTPQIYCCRECYNQACKNKRDDAYRKSKISNPVICQTCKQEFFRSTHYLKYCSDKCREIAYENKKQPKQSLLRPCEKCGKEIKMINNRQKYCNECIKIHNKERKSQWYFDKKKGD